MTAAPPARPGVPSDNPNWHRHQAAGHWTPPADCHHRPDPVFGPCTCGIAGPAPCPTAGLCDDDCEADCHEGHHVPWKRLHDPAECPSVKETTP